MLPCGIKRKKLHESGFVLPMVLLFLQFFGLYLLYTLEACVLSTKTSEHVSRNSHNSRELDQIMAQIEHQLVQQLPGCEIHPTPLEVIVAQPESWWQQQSCSGNFHTIQYYYVLEALGDDPCAHIDKAQGMVADYYRITLFSVDERSGVKTMVQTTQAIPLAEIKKCTDHVHVVSSGQQTWRLV